MGRVSLRMVVQLSKWISWQEYRHTVYVFNERTKRVYIFTDTARDFWTTIITSDNIQTGVASLCAQYGEDLRDTIQKDLLSFISELESYGLIGSFEGYKHEQL